MKPTPKPAVAAMLLAGALFTQAACNFNPSQPMPSVDDEGPAAPFGFSLSVARHIDQSFADERVDQILAQAGGILQSVETQCPDVACPVTFQRRGSVETFDFGPTIITTEGQLDDLLDHPADIKIVTLMIGVCGALLPGDLSQVLGCAIPGESMVIAHDSPTDVWAHEWGHVQGLPHRDDCDTNLMHSVALETNAVNALERDAFLSPTPTPAFFKAVPPRVYDGIRFLERRDGEPVPDWLERLVSRRYLAGLPEAALADVSAREALAVLLDMFGRSAEPVRRANSVRALGLIGDPQPCPALIEAMELLRGPLTADEVATAAETILALARLAPNDPTDAAVEYLIAGTAPATWRPRALTLGTGDRSAETLDAVLARLCILGLGIADHPAARAHLEGLLNQVDSGRLTGQWLPEQVVEAVTRSQGASAVRPPRVRPARMP